jgi:hypothetical protein
MEKFFNTAGPVNRPQHYKLDPLHRWNFAEILSLIHQENYFILHAPRQTGKTSSLLALADYLNSEGRHVAVYANIEAAQAARNDIDQGLAAVVSDLAQRVMEPALARQLFELCRTVTPASRLSRALSIMSEFYDKPLVLLIDEIDALVGDTLVSVLRQLRSGYDKRPTAFPSTVLLCGVRDIKDYRIHKSDDQVITGGSAFSIKAESLRLGNFSQEDIRQLYLQHGEATGQLFDDDCFGLVWRYTHGQPWLVNALAYEVTFKMPENRNRSLMITAEKMATAKARLVMSRQTHLDQLADKLSEDRVRRVILPMILGETGQVHKDDEQYCLDLGLVRLEQDGMVIANEIYREVIPRELTEAQQQAFLSRFQPRWLQDDGSINAHVMLAMFQEFWRENAAIWASHIQGYQEAAPQLVTQAFLQRVVNGQGSILREYAAGRGRTDLMLLWPYQAGGRRKDQKIVLELKIFRSPGQLARVKTAGLAQTAEYARVCNTTEAHLLLFDRNPVDRSGAGSAVVGGADIRSAAADAPA